MNCLKCGKEQFGLVDKIYLETFKVCWNCDWLKWKEGKLSLEGCTVICKRF